MNSAVLKKIQKLPEAYRKEFATLINDLQNATTSTWLLLIRCGQRLFMVNITK